MTATSDQDPQGRETAEVPGTADSLVKTPADDGPLTSETSPPNVVSLRPSVRLRAVALAVGIVVVVYLASISQQTSTYLKMTPGPAPEVTSAVTGEVPNVEFRKHGKIYYTTVQLDTITWAEWAKLKVAPEEYTEVVPADEVTLGNQEQAAAAARVLMEQSKSIAFAVASSEVQGGGVVEGDGAKVVSFDEASAAGRSDLQLGDVIVSVDDVPVTTAESLVATLETKVGMVELSALRAGEPVVVPVDLPAASPGEPRLGAQVGTVVAGAPELSVDTPGVGGPSGGLMFTLALTDALAEGDLTGDKDIAGTGTISLDGTVGPIGGVADKVVGAKRAGATVFFAPAANYDDAVAAEVQGVEVVRVVEYTDAIDWLCDNGATSSVCDSYQG